MNRIVPDLDDFSGVLSVRRGDDVLGAWAVGLADRTADSPNTPDTRFALASGSKTFTALTVLSLVRDGALRLDTTARSILEDDLPLIAADVTIDHLLTHRSGIGDYLDEDLDVYPPLSIPAQQLTTTPAFLPMLGGYPTKFPAGQRFSYCNGGYVVLALLAERASGTPYAQLVGERVFEPAGMTASGFPRSDHLPVRTAIGYLDDGRTNVFELPVIGSGDGGAYSTAADLHRFWLALLEGRIVPPEYTALAVEEVTAKADDDLGYGRGVWLFKGEVILSGEDHGVSAISRHDRAAGVTVTALANRAAPIWARSLAAMQTARTG